MLSMASQILQWDAMQVPGGLGREQRTRLRELSMHSRHPQGEFPHLRHFTHKQDRHALLSAVMWDRQLLEDFLLHRGILMRVTLLASGFVIGEPAECGPSSQKRWSC